MKYPKYNITREFNHWFFDEQYPEQGSNRAQVYMTGNAQNRENRDYWMRQAFVAGANSMLGEIDLCLLQWACAVEGLDPELLTPAEVFDRARENLDAHVKQLELF
jgi:hypothetical protein